MDWSSLAPKWPIPVPFCGMDHQKSNFSLTSDTLSVGGCWGQPMEFFWKLVDETQIFKPPEAARHHNSIRLLVLLPLRADLLYILHYETPCIDVKKLNDYEIINTFVHQGNKFQKLTMVYSILSKNLKRNFTWQYFWVEQSLNLLKNGETFWISFLIRIHAGQ